MKIPETLGATLSQNSRSSDQNSEKPMQITPNSKKCVLDHAGHFYPLFGTSPVLRREFVMTFQKC